MDEIIRRGVAKLMRFLHPNNNNDLKKTKTRRTIYSSKHRKYRKNYNNNKKRAADRNQIPSMQIQIQTQTLTTTKIKTLLKTQIRIRSCHVMRRTAEQLVITIVDKITRYRNPSSSRNKKTIRQISQ